MIGKKNITIKNKLIAMQLFITFVVLLFYTVFLVYREMNITKQSLSRKLTSMARLMGYNCKSVLNFLDNEAADKILSSLEAEKDVVNAWIYDARGKLFSQYSKAGYSNFAFPKIEKESQQWQEGYFTLSQPIIQESETIGMISLRYDMSQYRLVLIQNIFMAFLVLLVAMVVTFILSIFMQKTISNPVHHLAETVKQVSQTGNYLIRVKKQRNDEIGILYDGFNNMLDQVHNRELERNKAEDALKESEKRYRNIFQTVPISLWEEDLSELRTEIEALKKQGIEDFRQYFANHPGFVKEAIAMLKVVAVNNATVQLYGAKNEEEFKKRLNELFTPESLAVFQEELNAIAEGKTYFQSESITRTFKGERLDVLICLAIPGVDSGLQRTIFSVIDITERKKAEEALLQRVQEITALNNLSWQVSASLSVEQVVQSALAGICEPLQPDLALFFLRQEDRLLLKGIGPPNTRYRHEGAPIHQVGECLCGLAIQQEKHLYSNNINTDKRCTREECKKTGIRSFAALPLQGRDGIIGVLGLGSVREWDFKTQATFLETLANAIAIGLQNALLYEKVHQYSTDLEIRVRERTKKLSEANVKLKELDHLKSMFLASMSHELRTPLNSIIGFTGLLLMGMAGDLNQEQQKQLGMVKSSAKHLLSLINDVLDISKIESGKVDLMIETFSMKEAVNDVAAAILPALEDKELELIIDLPEEITINSDKRRVKQVLMNLAGNAVKFTQQGNIKITVREQPGHHVEVIISDTGIGIKPGDMEKLFQPFQQIDMSVTKKHEGTGLGLYLCNKLISLLQGSISAKSQYGKGSEFSFRLPLIFREPGTNKKKGKKGT